MYRTRLLPVLTLSAGLAMPALTVRADAVISGTPPTLTSQPSRPDQDGIVRGQAALRMKHFDQAERAFGEAYELNPRSVEAMLGLAAATQAQGKTRLARDWMSSAVAIAPGQANVLQAQARLLTEQGAAARRRAQLPRRHRQPSGHGPAQARSGGPLSRKARQAGPGRRPVA